MSELTEDKRAVLLGLIVERTLDGMSRQDLEDFAYEVLHEAYDDNSDEDLLAMGESMSLLEELAEVTFHPETT